MTGTNKTAFVTGGSGFLGRHIIDCLLEDGWAVTALYRPGTDINHLKDRGIIPPWYGHQPSERSWH